MLTDNARIEKIDDVVVRVKQREAGIESLPDRNPEDCSSRPVRGLFRFSRRCLAVRLASDLSIFLTLCFATEPSLVAGKNSRNYKPYTTAETMRAGWCWQIEHDELINRGYVYSSRFIDDVKRKKSFERSARD